MNAQHSLQTMRPHRKRERVPKAESRDPVYNPLRHTVVGPVPSPGDFFIRAASGLMIHSGRAAPCSLVRPQTAAPELTFQVTAVDFHHGLGPGANVQLLVNVVDVGADGFNTQP